MDHILFARGELSLDNVNSNEVEQVEWIARENLPALLGDSTRKLSPWFHLIGSKMLPHWWDNLDTVLEQDNANRQVYDFCRAANAQLPFNANACPLNKPS